MLAENLKNRKLMAVYDDMLFCEAVKNPKIAKLLLDWKKKYLDTASNKNIVKKQIDAIASLIGSSMENIELMDKITGHMMAISKFVGDEANDELANILGEL